MDYVKRVSEIANKFASELGLRIESVEWVMEFNTRIMRVIADSDNGLDIDDATKLNELISNQLDLEDFIEEEYMLEVSSPGAERELKTDEDLKRFLKSYIHIDFKDTFSLEKGNSVKSIEGYLEDFNNDTIAVKINLRGRIKLVLVEKSKILLVRLAIKF